MAKEGYLLDGDGVKYYPRPSHPIGTIIMTSSNVNPSGEYGGKWELIDKEFETAYKVFNASNVEQVAISSTLRIDEVVYERVGHNLFIRVAGTTLVDLMDDNVVLGQLNLAALGVISLGYSQAGVLFGADGGNGIINTGISNEGVITSTDVVIKGGETTLPKGATPRISHSRTIKYQYMLDEACNKFYWKRTA